jgi:hypothetical protein
MILESARDFFAKLREETGTDEAFIDAVWKLRYLTPSPKSSKGWPYVGLDSKNKPDSKLENPKVRVLRP